MSTLARVVRQIWHRWRTAPAQEMEAAQLEALRQHLLMQKAQLEELQRMKDQFAEHERAQLKAMLGGMLAQQRQDHADVQATCGSHSEGPGQGTAGGTPGPENREGPSASPSGSPEPERVMDREVNALMDILGARSFTILEEADDVAMEMRQKDMDAAGEEPP
uniref:Uncharacterized protein n=2 Tax=Auxenochlorella protothecoides TaxID=3075 RepID=A0A1D2A7H4_AUXPR